MLKHTYALYISRSISWAGSAPITIVNEGCIDLQSTQIFSADMLTTDAPLTCAQGVKHLEVPSEPKTVSHK